MKLESAVLGDAGFRVYNIGETDHISLKYKSPPYQKAFNAPYQCGSLASDFNDKIKQIDIDVKDMDIVVAYSDGMDDNLYED